MTPPGPEMATDDPPPAPLGARFLRIFVGQTVSTVGSMMSGVGVAIFVYLDTGNPAWLGVLAAVGALPYVLAGPFLSHADRFSRRSVMIGADVAAALGPTLALSIALIGELQVWHLIVASFLGGLGTAVQAPVSAAAIPGLVTDEALGRANGLAQLGPAAGVVLGPILATPLVAWYGIEAVLVVDLLTFAVGASLTALTPFADPPGDPDVDDDGTWAAAASWLRSSGRPLILLIGALAAVNFFLAFFNLGLLVLATEVAGPSRAGLVLGLGGAAMIGGSLLVGSVGVSKRPIQLAIRVLTVMAAGISLTALTSMLAVVIVGVAVALAGVPSVNAALTTVFQRRVPAQMQGRIFGLRSTITQVLGPVGSVIAGFVLARALTPAMSEGGALADTAGAVIGTGPGRGAALLLLGVGVGLSLVAFGLSTSAVATELDGDQEPRVS